MTGTSTHAARTVPWVIAGALVVLLQIYIYLAWIVSGQATPVSPGPDPVPSLVKNGILAFQVVNVSVGLWAVVSLIRSFRKAGALTAFQLLMIGWLLTYWQDPWLSAFHPIFIYNALVVNLGCWCEFLPGWSTPNGSRFPEPLLLNIAAYLVILPSAALPGLAAVRKWTRSHPNTGPLGRFVAAFLGVLLLWVPLEIISTRIIHVDIWPGSIQSLSLWGGTYYQVPLYEFFFFPAIVAGCSLLLFSGDRTRATFIERGLASIKATPRIRGLARLLAFVAYANLMNALYIGSMMVISTVGDPWPTAPSWLRGELCGTEFNAVCDGPWK